MTLRTLLTALVAICALLSTTACTSTTEPTEEHLAEPAEPEPPDPPPFEVHREEANAAFDARAERAKAEHAIDLWERALDDDSALEQDDETIAEVYEDLARAHYFVARYHAADGPTADAASDIAAWAEKGADAASEALRIRAPEFVGAIERGAPFETSLPDAPSQALDALLWYAKNLDLLADTTGVSEAVATTPVVESIMEFVLEERPDAHYGAAHRFFGVHTIERPFHRDPDASLRAFESALDAEPDFLLTRVLKARHLATATGDRDEFEAILDDVKNTEGDALPEASPENRISRQWAEELLEQGDEFFD